MSEVSFLTTITGGIQMNHITIMLYVTDVEQSADFWSQGFKISHIETIELPKGFISVKLTLLNQVTLQLFSKDFIAEFSPEVLTNTPSLLLQTSEIDKQHTALKEISPMVSAISEVTGKKQFYFADLDEHYFAVIEGY